jgi:hypothetical protein
MRTIIALGSALLLQACAAGNGPDERRTVGDSGSVVVLGAEEEHAFPFATRHCAAYGKVAEFKGMVPHRLSRYASTQDAEFICVRPSAPSDRLPATRP